VDFDWCVIAEPPTDESHIWHAVAPGSVTTLCGEPVANPDEEWRWSDKLGHHRECDNCGRIISLKADVSSGDIVVKPDAAVMTSHPV
jgi:hypothetical protein